MTIYFLPVCIFTGKNKNSPTEISLQGCEFSYITYFTTKFTTRFGT